MERVSDTLRSLIVTVEQSLEDPDINKKLAYLREESGVRNLPISKAPSRESLVENLCHLIEVSENLFDTELKVWPSGARNMLARTISGIEYIYNGV